MAGLSPRPDRDRDAAASAAGRDRAQLLLVGAFGLAVLLLVLAGVVNTVAYTESIATRGDGLNGGRDVAAFQADVRGGVGGAVARINADTTTTYTQKVTQVGLSVGNWSTAAAGLYVRDVAGVDVVMDRTVEGSRIVGDADSTLTNDADAGNWTLAADVSRTRNVRLNLSQTSLTTGSCATNPCFELAVVGSTSTWRVLVNQSYVTVRGPDTTGQCAIDSGTDRVLVDVTAGTVDGQPCEPLSFAEGVSAPYDIEFRNGGSAIGTYRLIVGPDAVSDAANYDESGPPSLSPAIYATYVRVTYRTPQVEYDTVIRVARGEPDA